jgi:hypothetical protein
MERLNADICIKAGQYYTISSTDMLLVMEEAREDIRQSQEISQEKEQTARQHQE